MGLCSEKNQPLLMINGGTVHRPVSQRRERLCKTAGCNPPFWFYCIMKNKVSFWRD